MLPFSTFRVTFSNDVAIVPKYKPFKDIDGKLYASRDKLYVQLTAFMIPKSSPLNASKIVELNCVNVLQSYCFRISSIRQFLPCWKLGYIKRWRMTSLLHQIFVFTLRSLFGQREMHMEISLSLYTMFYHHLCFLVLASYPP